MSSEEPWFPLKGKVVQRFSHQELVASSMESRYSAPQTDAPTQRELSSTAPCASVLLMTEKVMTEKVMTAKVMAAHLHLDPSRPQSMAISSPTAMLIGAMVPARGIADTLRIGREPTTKLQAMGSV